MQIDDEMSRRAVLTLGVGAGDGPSGLAGIAREVAEPVIEAVGRR